MRRPLTPWLSPRVAPWIAPAVAAVLGLVRMTSFDLPLMVACGERLLRGDGIPHVNPFHWPNPGFPWLDDKWGFGLLCAAAERAGGGAALSALNAVLAAAAGLVLHALARRRCGPWDAAGLATFGVAVLSYRSMLRAEWISYLGVAWTLLHLDGVLAGSWRRAACVVLAVPVWAACHVYWFLAPVLLAAAAIGARSRVAAATAGLTVLAAAVSPYGLANVAHPVRVTLQQGSTELAGAIVELRRPFVSGGPFTFFHLIASVAALQCAWWTVAALRSGRLADALATTALLAVSLRYDRNLALLGVAYVHAAPAEALGTARSRLARTLVGPSLAVALLAGHLLGAPWFAPERRAGVGWDDRAFPLALADAEPLAGRRFANDFSVGSFLDWKAGSSFVDGNTHGHPDAHFALYRRALEGSVTVREIDARFPNDGWFLRTSAPHTRVLVVGLLLEGDYAPVAHDAVATLFRAVDDPERADALWRDWLGDAFLPAARDWFTPPDEALAALGAQPAADDVAAWRRLVAASPLHRPFLDGLRAAYDARGEALQAARVWRIARRLE